MRIVKKIPKSAKCLDDNNDCEVGLYATHRCFYLVFKNVGDFVDGKYVRTPDEKRIVRLSLEETEEFMHGIFNCFSFLDLIDGKYVNQYII